MIGILGSGLMGKSIAIEFAKKNYNVIIYSAIRHASTDILVEELTRIALKDKNVNIEELFQHLKVVQDIEEFKNCKIIIEALKEDILIKREIISKLEIVDGDTRIFSSNTSSLNIKDIFIGIAPFSNVIGMHFFNPVSLMKLVEVSPLEQTNQEVTNMIKSIIVELGKIPVLVKNTPGFIVNRLLIPYINNAALLLDINVATTEDIDKAMIFGANHPIGPLKLADLIGLDVVYAILLSFKEKDDRIVISKTLENLVKNDLLGRKTKKGFYTYN